MREQPSGGFTPASNTAQHTHGFASCFSIQIFCIRYTEVSRRISNGYQEDTYYYRILSLYYQIDHPLGKMELDTHAFKAFKPCPFVGRHEYNEGVKFENLENHVQFFPPIPTSFNFFI
jgi:hypothetical protein